MVKAVQAGQDWRDDSSGANFLAAKVCTGLFKQYAMLRSADVSAPQADTVGAKIARLDQGMTLPEYTFTQDSQEF